MINKVLYYPFKCKKRMLPVVLLLLVNACFVNHGHAQDFDGLRTKWYGFLTGAADPGSIHDTAIAAAATAKKNWNELQKDTLRRTCLWTDLNYQYSKDITTSYTRLESMALSYNVPGSVLYHNSLLLADIVKAMDWLYKNQYNEHTAPPVPSQGSNIKNWWDYMIGTPLKINNIAVLLYHELTRLQIANYMNAVDHFTNDFTDRYTTQPAVTTFTAANRVWISTVICIRGIILKDDKKINYAGSGLSPVFQYVTIGDGFYTDGSFIQHKKHPYTGGYGVALIGSLTEELYLLAGSPWDIIDPAKKNVYQWVYNSFGPLVYKGAMMSMVEGREISRKASQELNKGRFAAKAILLLAEAAPDTDALRMKQIVKSWLTANSTSTPYAGYSGFYLKLVKKLLNNQSIGADTAFKLYKQYANMDRAVQHTPHYAFGISMHSSRIYNYETRTNYENIRGWHTGDGQTYLYNADIQQYDDDFWPTVNPGLLPGTTVEKDSKPEGWKVNSKSWVGGVSMLNKYGTSGMEMETSGQTLTGKKSWFMFDNEIVALGAGIFNHDEKDTYTIIEQRKLSGDNSNQFILDGKLQKQIFGSDAQPQIYVDTKWAWLSGNTGGAEIGYFFPYGTTIQATRQMQTGSWYDINTNQDKLRKKHFYLTLWNNHGAPKTDDNAVYNKYAYALLPGYSVQQVQEYAHSPEITIIENTDALQAVRENKLNLIAANFWYDKPASVKQGNSSGYLKCDKKASVMVLDNVDSITIAVSDPTMLNEGVINISVDQTAFAVISSASNIKVISITPTINISVNVKGLKGSTSSISLTKIKSQ